VHTLERSGFQVHTRVGSEAVLLGRLRAGDFDLAFVEWTGAGDRDLAPLVESGGAYNFGGFASRRVDELLVDLRSAEAPAERAPILAALAAVLAEEQPVVPLPAPDPYGLVHRRVQGVHPLSGWLSLRDLSLSSD
jgi:ABC-type transport system substrate-binding protein